MKLPKLFSAVSDKFYTVMSNLKLKNKYLLVGGVMLFSIIFILSIFSLIVFSNALDVREEKSMTLQLGHISDTIEAEIDAYRRVLESIYLNEYLHELILSTDSTFSAAQISTPSTYYSYYYDNIRYIEDTISNLLSSCKDRPELVLYLTDDQRPYVYDSNYVKSVSLVQEEEWYLKAAATIRAQMVWETAEYTPDEEDTQKKNGTSDEEPHYQLCCTLPIRNIKLPTLGKRIAYARLEQDMTWLDTPLSSYCESAEAIYIMDANGNIIYASDRDRELAASLFHFLSQQKPDTGTTGNLRLSKAFDSRMLYYTSLEDMAWQILYLTPNSLDSNYTYQLQLFTLVGLVPIIILSLILLLSTSNFITKRLVKLTDAVNQIDAEHLELYYHSTGTDEVGQLSDAFRNTLSMVKDLSEKNLELEQERHMVELQILQERTNPHFLYNTLSTINAMAMDIDAYSISEALSSLADFYRLSLSHGSEIITVREELEILESYINICRLRFGDKVNIIIDVPETFYDNKTPKLILQPFFENAILHGLRTRAASDEHVIVTAHTENDILIFCIRDNGVGIPSDRLHNIMNNYDSKEYHAISSTDKRIKLHFGSEYGINITTESGSGTTVYIRIPLQ